MGIKLKLSVIVEPQFKEAFTKLCNQRLPLSDSYKLSKVGRVITAAVEDFAKAQEEFFKANGEKITGTNTPNDGRWKLKSDIEVPGLSDRYQEQVKEAVREEVELPLLKPILLPATCDLNAADLFQVLDLVQVEEPNEPAPAA